MVVSRYTWPEGGGAELATWYYLREMSKHFKVTLVSGTRNPSRDLIDRVNYVFLPGLSGGFKLRDWVALIRYRDLLGRLVRTHDLVYIPSKNMYPAALLAKSVDPRKPVVIHAHDYQPITYTAAKFPDIEPGTRTDIMYERLEHGVLKAVMVGYLSITNTINELAVKYADLLIFVSKRQADYVMSIMPELRGKGVVIYNPPPSIMSGSKKFNDEPTAMFMGGSSKTKGFPLLIGSLIRALRDGVKVRVLVTNYILNGIKLPSRLNGTIQVLGRISHDELLSKLSETWFTVHPSIYEEPLPYSLLEGLFTHNLVIASKVGGIPEILSGTPMESFLFDPLSIDEFTEKIECAVSLDPGTIYDLSEKSMKIVSDRLVQSSSRFIPIISDLVNNYG
ncbi:MAG: glycosyltransferase family 4 protein [Vulcanisaeta sp.]